MNAAAQFDIKMLASIWTFITIIFSIGASYATIRLTLKHYAKDIADVKSKVEKHEVATITRIENHEHFVRGVLFRPNGATNYPTREECDACQARCQASISNNLSSMRAIIEESEKKRAAAKDYWSGEFQKIAQQIGRLEGRLCNGNGKS